MTEIILHQYPISPFAEKIRAILGYKRLTWRSVLIPVVMPKPELVALTGGYRKTPVLQIGCDVYCDTPLIARVLEEIAPEPPIYHASQGALGMAAGRWFDRELFLAAIAQLFHPEVAPASAQDLGGAAAALAFAEDRTAMMKSGPVRPPRAEDGRVLLEETLGQLERQLEQGGRFLFGEVVGWTDFCAYHPLWAMYSNRVLAPRLAPYPHVSAWLERIREFGHGTFSELAAESALAIARGSEPRARPAVTCRLERLQLGDEVEIAASDYALEPTGGRLVYVARDEYAIEREDVRAGRVVVHFPRVGFKIKKRS